MVLDPALSDMFWYAFAYASFAKLAANERARRTRKRAAVLRASVLPSRRSSRLRRFGAEPAG